MEPEIPELLCKRHAVLVADEDPVGFADDDDDDASAGDDENDGVDDGGGFV